MWIGAAAVLVLLAMPLVDYVYAAGVGHGMPAILLRALAAALCWCCWRCRWWTTFMRRAWVTACRPSYCERWPLANCLGRGRAEAIDVRLRDVPVPTEDDRGAEVVRQAVHVLVPLEVTGEEDGL